MMNEWFSLLKEANKELNLSDEIKKLEQMEEIYDRKEYIVSFMGQFSAGKSYLINNLLKKDILPQGIVETTPILTYIRYDDILEGLENCAVLYFQDGSKEKISLIDVKNIIQKKEDLPWDINNIDYLEVYLDEKILKNGMILLDTPGVNTIIERHEQLVAKSLLMSSRIIYVSGHSPSQVDIEKITLFKNQGFNILFVRTHCDEINLLEENIEEVIEKDLNILKEAGLDKEDCYFISNVKGSLQFEEISNLEKTLFDISEDINLSLEEDTKNQLMSITEETLNKLKDLKQILEAKSNDEQIQLENRKKKIEEKINALKDIISIRQNELDFKLNDCKKNIFVSVEEYSEKAIKKTIKNIIDDENNIVNDNIMYDFIEKEKQYFLQNLIKLINLEIDPILSGVNADLNIDFEFPMIDIPTIEHYQEMVNYQDDEVKKIQEALLTLESKKRELVENSIPDENIKAELIELEEHLLSIKNEFNIENNKQPKMIEIEEENSAVEIGKQIGSLVDWALIFAPIPSGGKVTKVAKLKKILGIGNKISKVERAAQYGLKAVNKYRAIKKTGTLDCFNFLTAEYWGEKIGECFKNPPKLILDEEYEKEHQKIKEELRQKILKIQQQMYQKKCEYNTFKNEQERQREERESLKVNEEILRKKLGEKEEEIKETSKKIALKKWKENYAQWYEKIMKEEVKSLIEDYLKGLEERIKSYQNDRFFSIQDKIEQENINYNNIISMEDTEVSEKLNRVNNLILKFDNYIN